jgi:Mg-chelatase subunit ChlD
MLMDAAADTIPTRDVAIEGDTTAFIEELAGLVRLAARRGDLVVQAGEPGAAWSFDWAAGVITVDPDDLGSLAPDLCRGLALHEAAHAAVTVLHEFLTRDVLERLMPLLNVVEDIRIEVWMRARFPGAVPWIRAYNDVFYGLCRRQPPARSRQVQFLRGILELWWYGAVTVGTARDVIRALDGCRDAVAAAVACQPPTDDDRPGVRAAQRSMWDIVRTRIVPVWERLVAIDRRDGMARVAADETREFLRLTGCPSQRGRSTVRMLRSNGRAFGQRPGRPPSGGRRRSCRPAADAAADERGDAYHEAWRRVAAAADRVGDELLRRLVPEQRLRWTTGHPSGARLDLRQAVAFEADRSRYRSLWSRPVLPVRRDPAVLLLVDRSGSMTEGERMRHAFDGLVLLVEVCRRVGVPAAVWSFASRCREELAWEVPLDTATRRRLGKLPASCNGMTHMAPALDAVRDALERRRGAPKLLVVLSDGEPDNAAATSAAVRRLDEGGIGTIGLGLGADTAGLSRYFPRSVTGIPPARIVDHLGGLLESTLAVLPRGR